MIADVKMYNTFRQIGEVADLATKNGGADSYLAPKLMQAVQAGMSAMGIAGRVQMHRLECRQILAAGMAVLLVSTDVDDETFAEKAEEVIESREFTRLVEDLQVNWGM